METALESSLYDDATYGNTACLFTPLDCHEMRENPMKSIPVRSSKPLPAVGIGFWKVENQNAAEVARNAIQMGYRHLDCAADYGNEAYVGIGIERALQDNLCSRDELWVTSKLWNTYHRPEHVALACERSLRDLRLEVLDLYLIHFPIALAYVPFEKRYPAGWFYDPAAPNPAMKPSPVPISETWGAMERLMDRGLVKNIGVSNFGTSLIRDVLSYARIRPSVLQVESHPYLVQSKLMRYCESESIAVTAFSPLGAPSYIPLGMATESDSVLAHTVVCDIAQNVSRTPAQVVLRWGVQRGTAVIPKSSHPARMQQNLCLFDFELTDLQMQAIAGLDRNQRFNDPGVFCELAFGCYFPIYE
jgi:D-xylose reductase